MTALALHLAREQAAEPTTAKLTLSDGSTFEHAKGPCSWTTRLKYERGTDARV